MGADAGGPGSAPSVRRQELETLELARQVADALADKQAEDIVVLDLRGTTLIADYFVIGAGTTERQLGALVDALLDLQRVQDIPTPKIEGTPESGWVLVDLGGVIVHVFSPARRSYYQLEQLWSGAKMVVRMA